MRTFEALVRARLGTESESGRGIMVLDQNFTENQTTGLSYSKDKTEGICLKSDGKDSKAAYWTAHSDDPLRIDSNKGAKGWEEESKDWVHIVVVYSNDGTIRRYRNSKPYGPPFQPSGGARNFNADSCRLLFGVLGFDDAKQDKDSKGKAKNLGGLEIKHARFFTKALASIEVEACYINLVQKYKLKLEEDKTLIPYDLSDEFVDWAVTSDGRPAVMWKNKGEKPQVHIFETVDVRTGLWEGICFVHDFKQSTISLLHNDNKCEEWKAPLGLKQMALPEAWIGTDLQKGSPEAFKGDLKYLMLFSSPPTDDDDGDVYAMYIMDDAESGQLACNGEGGLPAKIERSARMEVTD
jgi:hypothetical protein